MGVNIPDLLLNYLGLSPGGVSGAQADMDAAVAQGVTFARFIASGFYAGNMTTGNGWLNNPTAYWAAFDALVADANARGLHLVPSMLWNIYLFPDMNSQPAGQLFVPGSATRVMAESYLSQVVSRYASNDTILFWEMGNEFNLLADIDVTGQAGGPGGPATRTAADDIYSCNACRGVSTSQEDLGQFTSDIAALVRGLDPSRPFSSGNGYPRPAAWHLGYSPCPACDWTPDSPSEYQQALAQISPVGVDLVSVHHYPGPDNQRFGSPDPMGIDLLAETQSIVQGMGRQLYVGEYGQPGTGSPTCGSTTTDCAAMPFGGDGTFAVTRRVMDALVFDQVPYASLWAWDFFQLCATVPTCYTVTPTDPLAAALTQHDQATWACIDAGEGSACPLGACAGGICTPQAVWSTNFSDGGSAWINWTNCSSCTSGTMQVAAVTDGGSAMGLQLVSNDLPCSGTCMFPGVYALSLAQPASPGHALVSFVGSTNAAQGDLRFIPEDGAGHDLGSQTAAFPTSFDQTAALWMTLPTGTVQVQARLELLTPSSGLDLQSVNVVLEP